MIIAINTRVLSANDAIRQSLIDQFTRLAQLHPEHQFVFVSAGKKPLPLVSIPNMSQLQLPQTATSTLLLQYWYRFTLPNAVRKMGAHILVSAEATCAISNKIPQLMLVNEVAFQQHPGWYPKHYITLQQRLFPVFMQKATRIVAAAAPAQAALQAQFPSIAEKLQICLPAADDGYHAMNFEAAAVVKDRFTEGREFFLFNGSIHARSQLINLLKAFSLFKKRQKSNMQLVLASAEPVHDPAFVESLQLYKFRTDVHLLPGQPAAILQQLTGAAYAVINLAPLHNDILQLLNAIQCRVPVIAGEWEQSRALLGDAALYAAADNPSSIAAYLMHLYKDETSRKELIEKGASLAGIQTNEQYSTALWQLLLDTIAAA